MELVLDSESKKMEFKGTIAELLRHLKLMREEVVVKLNGKMAPETARIMPDDRVEVIKVVFGG